MIAGQKCNERYNIRETVKSFQPQIAESYCSNVCIIDCVFYNKPQPNPQPVEIGIAPFKSVELHLITLTEKLP